MDLYQRGFKFVGPTICYAFMQAVACVNDHLWIVSGKRSFGSRNLQVAPLHDVAATFRLRQDCEPQVALAQAEACGYIARVAEQVVQIKSNLAVVRDHSRHLPISPSCIRLSRGGRAGCPSASTSTRQGLHFDCIYCE